MKYDSMRKGMAEADSSAMSSVVATEFQLAAAFVLLAFLALRLVWGAVPALAAAAVMGLLGHRLVVSFKTFRENSDRFQILLFYFVLTITLIVVLVGWRP